MDGVHIRGHTFPKVGEVIVLILVVMDGVHIPNVIDLSKS